MAEPHRSREPFDPARGRADGAAGGDPSRPPAAPTAEEVLLAWKVVDEALQVLRRVAAAREIALLRELEDLHRRQFGA